MNKQLLLLVMILLPMMANADQSGTCGKNVNWSFVEATHTLTISGNGEMENFMNPSHLAPWDNFQTSITKIVIEEGVQSIGNEAFIGCVNVIDVAIASSVITIGRASFWNCSSLITLKIPNNVTSIGEYAFIGCSSLTSVDISDISAWCNIDFDGAYSNPLELAHDLFINGKIATNLTIPNTVDAIKKATFLGCSSLTSIVVPSSVTSIGESAFANCSGLFDIKMSEGLNSIGYSAFSGCSSLNSIIIPNSVLTIDDLAFEYCTSLTSVILPNGITAIQPGTFAKCESLVSIVIPEGVTTLKSESNKCGNYGCFWDCKSLVSVSLPQSLTTIENSIFNGCSSLTSINIPEGVISIGNSAFIWCGNLQSLTIPNGVKSIGEYAFYDCSGITSISIPNSIESIGVGVFSNCKGLASVTIPSNLLSISESAFEGCSGLITLSLPDNLQIIRKKAFYGCSSLENLTFPASVELIYQEAFAGCSSLAAINAKPTTPPFLYDNSFSNYTIPLKVPKGYKDAYQTAQGWKNFTNISDADKYKLTYVVDNEEYKSYEIEEGTTITPEPAPTKEGYTFSGWSEIPETMPAHDVTVTGTFSINKYKLIYTVDGEEYKTYEVEYGATITSEAAPTKEGYTFSGWSEIPETMPAHDITVTGTFSINKYKLTYTIDGEEYKSYELDYGASITPETAPTKEGYTFSGWSKIPETMPAHDVTVTGTFTINKYKLTYIVDGQTYKTYDVEYGAAITPEPAPTKEGYTFSGWSEIPEIMPSYDVTVTGTFTKGAYILTYMVDGKEYKTVSYDYGDAITPEPAPTKEGYTFSGWSEIPATMPAHDVTITGTFTINKYKLMYMVDGAEYKSYEV